VRARRSLSKAQRDRRKAKRAEDLRRREVRRIKYAGGAA